MVGFPKYGHNYKNADVFGKIVNILRLYIIYHTKLFDVSSSTWLMYHASIYSVGT